MRSLITLSLSNVLLMSISVWFTVLFLNLLSTERPTDPLLVV